MESPIEIKPNAKVKIEMREEPVTLVVRNLDKFPVSKKGVQVLNKNATSHNPDFGNLGSHIGQKVAIHVSEIILAYVLGQDEEKISGSANYGSRKVVVSRINGIEIGCFFMRGAIQDLQFAKDHNEVVLAVTDVFGDLKVVEVIGNKIHTILDVEVGSVNPTHYHLVRWCPYIPGADEDGFLCSKTPKKHRMNRLLVVINNACSEVWNLDQIVDEYIGDNNRNTTLKLKNILTGRVQTDSGKSPVVDVSISPDGTTFAVINMKGEVLFYDLETAITSKKTPCLRKTLIPSGESGSSHSFIHFTDNLKITTASDDFFFWRHLIVGNNNVLTVYDMGSWDITQTVVIQTPGNVALKATKDISGKHLLLTCMEFCIVLGTSVDGIESATVHKNAQEYKFAEVYQSENEMDFKFVGLGVKSLDVCGVCLISRPFPKQSSPGDIVIRKARINAGDDSTPENSPSKKDLNDNVDKKLKNLPKCDLDLTKIRIKKLIEQNGSSEKPSEGRISRKTSPGSCQSLFNRSPRASSTPDPTTPVETIEEEPEETKQSPGVRRSLTPHPLAPTTTLDSFPTQRRLIPSPSTPIPSPRPPTPIPSPQSANSSFNSVEVCLDPNLPAIAEIQSSDNCFTPVVKPEEKGKNSSTPLRRPRFSHPAESAFSPVMRFNSINKTVNRSELYQTCTEIPDCFEDEKTNEVEEVFVEPNVVAKPELMEEFREELKKFKYEQFKMIHGIKRTFKKEIKKLSSDFDEDDRKSVASTCVSSPTPRHATRPHGDANLKTHLEEEIVTASFERVNAVLLQVKADIENGRFDQAWKQIVGERLDDLVALDMRDMIAKSKQENR